MIKAFEPKQSQSVDSSSYRSNLLLLCVRVCITEDIMVVKPPTRQPRNVKFRLWLSVELIYMPLMSPPPAVLVVLRRRKPPCSQKLGRWLSS